MEGKWYIKTPPEAFKALHSTDAGLSAEEAAKRLAERGPNALPEPPVPGVLSIFFSQFASPLIYLLIAAAVIVLLMGETIDAAIIFLVLFFNAVVGTVQEGRAEHTLAALKKFVETSASVMRDGKIVVMPDREIVPGDVIVLQEGDKVPADARLFSVHALKVDESSLTGESIPVAKTDAVLGDASLPIQERKNAVFKGTNIVGGNGMAVVVATGVETEIGRISREIAAIDTDVPLKKNIQSLSRLIIITVASIGTALMVFGLASGKPLFEMFATVVSLSVSIIPEGLPIVMTLVLASGVWRMTKRNVLVKKLQAVEALGQAKVIAVDKTGTLTKNEMTLQKVWVDNKTFDITGEGYEPKGEALLAGKIVDPLNHPDLLLAGRVAAFSADGHASYLEETKTWRISGDPTEAALEVFARKIGFKESEREAKRIFELPFDYLVKYHVTINELEGKNLLAVVGAPERILGLSEREWRGGKSEKLFDERKRKLEEIFLEFSAQGLRVLAFAVDPDAPAIIEAGKFPPLTFVGFFAMKDPLRDEAVAAIREAHEAGIRVVMITGDHAVTARAIAVEAGLVKEGDGVLTGEELQKLSDEKLMERFAATSVFARVTPEDKLRIIELFRKRGEVVAMTGDGVNDAPSLAAADLGVAMGKIGTEVAKEASDLVLLDDNFGNIIAAVEEGRSIYKTIRKVILYLFSTSIGEVLTISGALVLGLPLPLLPAQIIWLNFVTDGFLDVSLAMEPKEVGLLGRHLRKPSKYILDGLAAKRMVFMGVVIAAGSLFVFTRFLGEGIEKALTMVLTTLAVFQWFNAWNCKSENKSIFAVNPFNNLFLVGSTITIAVLQVLAVYNPFMESILHTVPLSGAEWIYAVGIAASVIVLEELRKIFARGLQYFPRRVR
ncbi:HAD-IC family P-type ATPase [Patescibacteria group bacterium]|nr:HAD-IC family P-type ATPase [Patescibacteria group bacterium]